ncbi:MAG TPA: hypothetical protein VGM39_18165 [Kofleriaceae bacterium]|jgi:hypothetical protein
MRLLSVIAIAGALAPAVARADGVYASESIGVSIPDDSLAPYLQQPLKVRLAVGARWRFVAVEPWLSSDLQLDRDGATRGILGGTPAQGTADLATYGIDAKLIGKLDEHLSAYVRMGPSRAEANGMLDGYAGWGMGAAAGVQLTGRVRALGFLWTPLFFVKRGPMITGSLFLDQGVDFYRLRMSGAPDINARVAHVSIGFALGSDF